MKHRYKTKNTLKEPADSQEDEEELLKDRRESSYPKSQEDPEEEDKAVKEENNDTPETHYSGSGFQPNILAERGPLISSQQHMGLMPPLTVTPLSNFTVRIPPSSAAAPPALHHWLQRTITEPGNVTTEQGIEPLSPSDSVAAFPSHMSASGSRPRPEMGQLVFLAKRELNQCFSFSDFLGKTSKILETTDMDLFCDEGEPWCQSDLDFLDLDEPAFSSAGSSALLQPEDVNVCEPLRKRSLLEGAGLNKDFVVGEPEGFPVIFPQSMFPYKSAFSPPLNSEVSQTEVGKSSDSAAEIHEDSEPLTIHFQEDEEGSCLPASEPKTVHYGRTYQSYPFIPIHDLCTQSITSPLCYSPEWSFEEKLEEETGGGFLGGAECSPAVNSIDGAAPSPVRAEYVSATNIPPPSSHLQVSSSCCLTRSHSAPSMSQTPKSNFRRAASLADMKLKEFTPAISAADGDDETYSFLCSCPGLYQCSVSGLVFSMKGEGDVVYRTVPWNRRLLAQHHKKPAGPLFDIKCLQQSVCQLHLPHCEIISTGGGRSLQVAHINDDVIEFISPHQVKETHVVLNISGFSAYGNVKDEDSPPDPVRALVLLFYKPPEDPDLRSVLSVLLLPRNIVIRDVQRTRRKLIGEERYLDTSPHCKLHPKQVYTLSTSPEDDLIKVQPKETEFDGEHHESYFPSFQVVLKRILTDVNLTLRDSSSSSCVWEREVCLLPSGVKTLDTGPKRRPSDLRSSFVRRISGPVLNSLLDQLLDKRVITDAEKEAADAEQSRSDRARFVFDTVSNKGEAARSEMMEFLCEEDPFLCEHLELKQNGKKAS